MKLEINFSSEKPMSESAKANLRMAAYIVIAVGIVLLCLHNFSKTDAAMDKTASSAAQSFGHQ